MLHRFLNFIWDSMNFINNIRLDFQKQKCDFILFIHRLFIVVYYVFVCLFVFIIIFLNICYLLCLYNFAIYIYCYLLFSLFNYVNFTLNNLIKSFLFLFYTFIFHFVEITLKYLLTPPIYKYSLRTSMWNMTRLSLIETSTCYIYMPSTIIRLLVMQITC